jgi:hypothetical protein
MRRPTYANVVSTIALVLAAGGGTYAVAAQSGSGAIKGCSHKKTGALRVLSGTKKCKRTERALSWNVEGAPGATGTNGSAGLNGAKGENGPAGAAGSNGAAGAAGANGAIGPTGPAGADGTNGTAGTIGATGPTGPEGKIGPTGPAGSPDTANQILTKLATVDGAGSSLDADLLDGFDGASYGREIATQEVTTMINANPGACGTTSSSVPAGVLESDYFVIDFSSVPSGVLMMPFGIASVIFPAADVVAVIRFCNIAGSLPGSITYKLHFIR